MQTVIPDDQGNLWTSDQRGISLYPQLDQSLITGRRQSVCQPCVPPPKSLPPRHRLGRQRRSSRFEVQCPLGTGKLGPNFFNLKGIRENSSRPNGVIMADLAMLSGRMGGNHEPGLYLKKRFFF